MGKVVIGNFENVFKCFSYFDWYWYGLFSVPTENVIPTIQWFGNGECSGRYRAGTVSSTSSIIINKIQPKNTFMNFSTSEINICALTFAPMSIFAKLSGAVVVVAVAATMFKHCSTDFWAKFKYTQTNGPLIYVYNRFLAIFTTETLFSPTFGVFLLKKKRSTNEPISLRFLLSLFSLFYIHIIIWWSFCKGIF